MKTKKPTKAAAKKAAAKPAPATTSAAPAKKSRKASTAKPASKPKKAVRRKTYVRNSILDLLKAKRMTRNQLLAEGGFAASALDRNLKLLRDDKLIDTQGTRPLLFGLAGATSASSPKAAAPETPTAVAEVIPRNSKLGQLHEALDQYHRRMSPKEHVPEKLLVLERLAEGASAPIADILRAIQRDYAQA